MIPELSLFFFSADASEQQDEKYRMLLETSKFADEHGFTAIWTPERHFQRFGGLYGNPSVTGAALAMVTKRISIRAGSVVLPLQDVLRVAEEWSMVDNLSQGRVAIAAASGWHVNDFVLNPGCYQDRNVELYTKIEVVKSLWRGEKICRPNGAGVMTEVGILPRPIQAELPVWVTGRSDDTFLQAGRMGLNILTGSYAVNHNLPEFIRKVKLYRAAMQEHHNQRGHVTLMAHTFVGEHWDAISAIAEPALLRYLSINLQLQKDNSAGLLDERGFSQLGDRESRFIIRAQAKSDLASPLSFIGPLEHCRTRAAELHEYGVDEIACLIDFGVCLEEVMASLQRLSLLLKNRAPGAL